MYSQMNDHVQWYAKGTALSSIKALVRNVIKIDIAKQILERHKILDLRDWFN